MRAKFDCWFRGGLVLLAMAWAWSFWAGAQTNSNRPAAALANHPPTWVQELEHAEEHPLTFKLDEIPELRQHSLFGEPLWKYLASLIYVALAICVAKLIDIITRIWLVKLAARTANKLDDLLLRLLRGPIKVVVFVVLLNVGLSLFDWSVKVRLYLSKGLILVVAASLTYLALKVLDVLLDVWKGRHAQEADRKFNDQLFSVIRISINTFIIVMAVLVTAQNMDINITAAIASLSIGGLAVGLAAQDTLANLFGAVAVFVDKPFRVGDQIRLDGAEGMVETVGLRSTRLRNPEGHLVAVPNKTMGNATITNITQRPSIKTVMNLALAKDLSAAKIRRAVALLEEIYRAHPMTEQVLVSFNQFTGANINVLVVHWWKGTNHQKYLAGIQEMNLAVKERFDAEGISFA